ncbi:hypothetical protein [Thiorhodovibrio frisius]|uniref:Tetratricopeptide repeat protein n=1 Tax=Thiorhodovibrio frisius TaxID=631362 RepID=H8Z3G9_9GAMM|nr:hypothetical protein [Thiorhodovibrio frisius]EIC21877.1 hypothetical protein Thi970DRAFT_02112 [Thiorhodovibrio frisius]WPL24166.1 hypothetical protein Thiofri_04380 [Thiorhodovibrio frisius]
MPKAALAHLIKLGNRLSKRHGRQLARIASLAIAGALLSGCPADPMGPDNRMALIAFGRCDYQQAMQLTERVIEQEKDVYHVQRAWVLKAAILHDMGKTAAAEAIYPEIEAAWKAVRKSTLKTNRRERDIAIMIDIAHNERQSNGLPVDCDR